jgi:hypothetical protein
MRDDALAPLEIDFLYLDDTTCGRCRGTGAALDRAVAAAAPALAAMGLTPAVTRRHVRSAEEAAALGFVASPSVRVDGRDIQPDIALSPCRECGDLCGCPGEVDCRVWRWRGTESTEAPVDLLIAAILAAALDRSGGAPTLGDAAIAPDGGAAVQRFFDAAPASAPIVDAPAATESDCGCAPACCGGAAA